MAEAIISRRGGGGGVKISSLQRGTRTTYGTLVITPVDMSKAVLFCNQTNPYYSGSPSENLGAYAYLSGDGASIVFEGASSSVTGRIGFAWQVVELENVKRIQRGTANGTADITIQPVNLAKSILIVNKTNGYGTEWFWNTGAAAYLKDSATIGFVESVANYFKIYWQVVEFN